MTARRCDQHQNEMTPVDKDGVAIRRSCYYTLRLFNLLLYKLPEPEYDDVESKKTADQGPYMKLHGLSTVFLNVILLA